MSQTIDTTGSLFTLRWTGPGGNHYEVPCLTEADVERAGRVVTALTGRAEARNIAVLDAEGVDVTFDVGFGFVRCDHAN